MKTLDATNHPTPSNFQVEKRSIYPRFGRKRIVWDARCMLGEQDVRVLGEPSRKAALEALRRDCNYILEQGALRDIGDCSVVPNGFESWQFWIGKRCIMNFGAPDLHAAAQYAAHAYRDHPGCAAFAAAMGEAHYIVGQDLSDSTLPRKMPRHEFRQK